MACHGIVHEWIKTKKKVAEQKTSLISHLLLLANLNMVCNSFSSEFLIFHDTQFEFVRLYYAFPIVIRFLLVG